MSKKRLKTPDLARLVSQNDKSQKFFFQGGNTMEDFSSGGQKHFSKVGPTVVIFHFIKSKLRGKQFSTKIVYKKNKKF